MQWRNCGAGRFSGRLTVNSKKWQSKVDDLRVSHLHSEDNNHDLTGCLDGNKWENNTFYGSQLLFIIMIISVLVFHNHNFLKYLEQRNPIKLRNSAWSGFPLFIFFFLFSIFFKEWEFTVILLILKAIFYCLYVWFLHNEHLICVCCLNESIQEKWPKSELRNSGINPSKQQN